MSSNPTPPDPAPPTYEVPDGAAAFQKLQDATRRMLAVPKKEFDAAEAKAKQAKKPKS